MRDILIIARLTWQEAHKRKIFWAALGLGVIFIALYSVGFFFMVRDMREYMRGRSFALNSGFNFTVMAGFYVISFLGVMLAVLTSVGALSGEISSHTIQVLAVKPMPRNRIILGKWLGLAAMLGVYIAFLSEGIALSTRLISGYMPSHLLEGILLIILQAVIMLSIALLGGTRLSTVANGVIAFMLYGLAFIGGWLEQIGSATSNQTMVDLGIISSLIVPSEAMWKMAAHRMQHPLITSLGISPFSVGAPPSRAMLGYALLYVGIMLGLAIWSFNRRDL
ncbi:MAG: ABC transporter permease [Chloroflexota bacterium]|nr:ABC transporter permease [Chloroflexota bacterium]